MKKYSVFHASLLEPIAQYPSPGQIYPPPLPPPIIINGELEHVVVEILDAKPRGKKLLSNISMSPFFHSSLMNS